MLYRLLTLQACSLVLGFLLTSCGGLTQKAFTPEDAETTARTARKANAQAKWDALAAELKIPNNHMQLNDAELAEIAQRHSSTLAQAKAKEELIAKKYRQVLGQPSDFLTDKSLKKQYKDLVLEIANDFADKAYATRCAAVVSFKPSPLVEITKDVNVFTLRYRLHASRDGREQSEIKTGLISIPKSAGSFHLLGFAHGDDQGLSYPHLEYHLNGLQESHIVIAPSFPGEPVCAGDTGRRNLMTGEPNQSCAAPEEMIAPPTGVSIPWDNDVDELLGMYDCVVKVASKHFASADTPSDLTPFVIAQENKAATLLSAELAGKVPFAKPNGSKAFPMGSLAGVSRGGLVASLAMAKAGAHWNRLLQAAAVETSLAQEAWNKLTPAEQSKASMPFMPLTDMLFGYLMTAAQTSIDLPKYGPEEKAYYMAEIFGFIGRQLGSSYGILPPPAFHGLVTLAAPTSVIAGRLRLQLEQMVKGNGDITPGRFLPGMRQLASIFDAYRNDQESIQQAVKHVISRDITFLSPFMFASLKRWHKAAAVTKNAKKTDVRGLRERGSLLMVHHEDDKVVPFEQTQIAANILSVQANDPFVRGITLSPAGVELSFRPLVSSAPRTPEGIKTSYHLDHAFYSTSTTRVRSDFIKTQVLARAYGKSWFYDHQSTTDAEKVNATIRQNLTLSLEKAAKLLAGTTASFDGIDFSTPNLELRLNDPQAQEASSEHTAIMKVLHYHAVNGSMGTSPLGMDDNTFISDDKPDAILTSWSENIYR